MHEPAGPSTLPLAESVNPSVTPSTTADIISRPKIMRRPATFSSAVHNNPLPFELLKISPIVEHVASHHFRPWQDDGRFGMTLLVIVVVIIAISRFRTVGNFVSDILKTSAINNLISITLQSIIISIST
jgi:hypothetical protein